LFYPVEKNKKGLSAKSQTKEANFRPGDQEKGSNDLRNLVSEIHLINDFGEGNRSPRPQRLEKNERRGGKGRRK